MGVDSHFGASLEIEINLEEPYSKNLIGGSPLLA
jgi:hypothetical protein